MPVGLCLRDYRILFKSCPFAVISILCCDVPYYVRNLRFAEPISVILRSIGN
jgi:hypothetical protein